MNKQIVAALDVGKVTVKVHRGQVIRQVFDRACGCCW